MDKSYSNWKLTPTILIGTKLKVTTQEQEDFEGQSANYHVFPQLFLGNVIGYNAVSQKHKLTLLDHQHQEFDLKKHKFSVVVDGKIVYTSNPTTQTTQPVNNEWTTNYSTYSYNQFIPYFSKTPGSTTPAVFNLYLDQSKVLPGNVVIINGNLDCMSAMDWGIPMTRDPSNPNLWSIVLNLPFYLNEYCATGVFKFRYEVTTGGFPGKAISEGQADRIEYSVKSEYFHVFRPNYTHQRFHGAILENKPAFHAYVLNRYEDYKLNLNFQTPEDQPKQTLESQFLDHYSRISESFRDVAGRTMIEQLFEREITQSETTGQPLSTKTVLLFLAMIGSFTKSSLERITHQSYVYPYTPTFTFRLPPAPSKWVNYLVKELDVAFLDDANWVKMIGYKDYWAATGIAEAIERLAEHGSFDWLILYPLAKRFNLELKTTPSRRTTKDTQKKSKRKGRKSNARKQQKSIAKSVLSLFSSSAQLDDDEDDEGEDDEFYCVLDEINLRVSRMDLASKIEPVLELSEELFSDPLNAAAASSSSSETSMTTAESTSEEKHEDSADLLGLAAIMDEEAPAKTPAKNKIGLPHRWLGLLIRFAPSLDHLTEVLSSQLVQYDQLLESAFSSRIQSEHLSFDAFNTFEQLQDLVVGHESFLQSLSPEEPSDRRLRIPNVATAAFKNESANDLKSRLFAFVSQTIDAKFRIHLNRIYNDQLSSISKAIEKNPSLSSSVAFPSSPTDPSIISSALMGPWLALNTAAKEFIKRNHELEPLLEGDEIKSTANYYDNWTTVNYYDNRVKRRPPTAEQIRAHRVQHLHAALEDVNELLKIPFFSTYSQGILFELSRCWVFTGQPLSVVETLLQVSSDFDRFEPLLRSFIEVRLIRLVKEVSNSPLLVSAFINLVCTILNPSSLLMEQLLCLLSITFCWPSVHMLDENLSKLPMNQIYPPSYDTVISNTELWLKLLQHFPTRCSLSNISDVLTLPRNLEQLMARAANTILEIMVSMLHNTITVEHMKITFNYMDSLLDLFDAFQQKFPNLSYNSSSSSSSSSSSTSSSTSSFTGTFSTLRIDRRLLESRQKLLTNFDMLLLQVQTYTSFYCASGVRIDSSVLKTQADYFRRNYLNCKGVELVDAFRDSPLLPHLDFLYNFRSSELFLNIWRNSGTELVRKLLRLNQEEGQTDGLIGNFNLFDDEHGQPGMVAPGENPATAEEAEARRLQMLQHFQRQDQLNAERKSVESFVLPEDVVVAQLLPHAQEVTQTLGFNIFREMISIQDLESTFGKITTGDQMLEELNYFAKFLSTLDRSTLSPDNLGFLMSYSSSKQLINLTFQHLNDYYLLRQLCIPSSSVNGSKGWISSILRIHDLMISLFSNTNFEEDSFRVKLIEKEATIMNAWTTLTLQQIPTLVMDVREVFVHIPPDILNFLSALKDSPELIHWLLEHKSTEEFNRLLQVVRPCTDEPRMLSAIASLVAIRTLLIQPLYSSPPYDKLEDFLLAFSHLDFGSTSTISSSSSSSSASNDDPSPLWHVNNIVSTFDSLMNVFEKQTRSPGIKSCYDLKEILDFGWFILKPHHDPTQILSLEIRRKDEEIKTEPLDYLLDIRSKLMMTEIPPELDEEMKATVMVHNFVTQMQILSEMSDSLSILFNSGHVEYQNNFSFQVKFTLNSTVEDVQAVTSLVKPTTEPPTTTTTITTPQQTPSFSEICPGIYICRSIDVSQPTAFEGMPLSSPPGLVLNLSASQMETENFYGSKIQTRSLILLDEPKEGDSHQTADDLESFLVQFQEEIQSTRTAGESVFIHDESSISRSPSLLIAHLMSTLTINAAQATSLVRNKWPITCPSDSFIKQLVSFESKVLGVEFLKQQLYRLQNECTSWGRAVRNARSTHYFLNFFTMRDVLRMREILLTNEDDLNAELESIVASQSSMVVDLISPQDESSSSSSSSSSSQRLTPKEIEDLELAQVLSLSAQEAGLEMDISDPSETVTVDLTPTTSTTNPIPPPPPPSSSSSTTSKPRSPRVCAYFTKGNCRFGEACYFLHPTPEPAPTPSTSTSTSPPEEGTSIITVNTSQQRSYADFVTPEQASLVSMLEDMGFLGNFAFASLRRNGFEFERAVEFCLTNSQYMDRIIQEEFATLGGQEAAQKMLASSANTSSSSSAEHENSEKHKSLPSVLNIKGEILSLLHQVTSSFNEDLAFEKMKQWKSSLLLPGEEILASLGQTLEDIFRAEENWGRKLRMVSRLGTTGYRSDLLYIPDDGSDKRLPIFCASTDDPSTVLENVLSIYVRRERVPEPSEIYFCTNQTTPEDINIFLYRFIRAKQYARGLFFFCIADLHNLPYSIQSHLVETLRSMLQEFGHESAATLVIVSGNPNQVALNALSSHMVDLSPLNSKHLKTACEEAFTKHCGRTECIGSTINGGGKTSHILSMVSRLQQSGDAIKYRKVPLRESTNPEKMIGALTSLSRYQGFQTAFHIDIGHILPPTANTLLFQLLIVGILKDPKSSRVYHRSNQDIFFLEVPNSPKNKTALALKICTLIPTTILEVDPSNLKLTRPVFHDINCSEIRMVPYMELIDVCKWLKAIKSKSFEPRGRFHGQKFEPELASSVSETECFKLLTDICNVVGGPSPMPSWSIFRSFVVFINSQFSLLNSFDLLGSGIFDTFDDDMSKFRSRFLMLLIETSKDFSLRSVPQIEGVGPTSDSEDVSGLTKRAVVSKPIESIPVSSTSISPPLPPSPTLTRPVRHMQRERDVYDSDRSLSDDDDGGGLFGGDDDDNDEDDDEDLPRPPQLVRAGSHEVRLARGLAEDPPPLIRHTSEEMFERFQSMANWEQSDHPFVMYVMQHFEVSGVTMLSTNAQYASRYFQPHVIQALQSMGMHFNKDWSKITNAEAAKILRDAEGLSFGSAGGVSTLTPGYVLTIDNLLKMLSILLRLKFHLPVIIMGETGAGKSSLIINMCNILGIPLHIFNIHGGIEDADIIEWLEVRIAAASRLKRGNRMVLFLDEINTCNCMSLFKEIVCDRSYNGKPIPENIQILAACNPYRLRSTQGLYGGEEMAGLAYETFNNATHVEGVGTGINDPLRNLVYRVHPLPESMVDYVFDFGSLSSDTEKLYIQAMLRHQLGAYNEEEAARILEEQARIATEEPDPSLASAYGAGAGAATRQHAARPFSEFVEVFTELVCAAQECIRELHGGERSSASLRDVSRCVKVFVWFGRYFANSVGKEEGWTIEDFFRLSHRARDSIRQSVILALGYCYHARLPRAERTEMITAITQKWRDLQYTVNTNYGLYGGYGYYGYGAYGAARQPQMIQRPKCAYLDLNPGSFESVLRDTQKDFVSQMNLGDGIALNEALLENLFMIMVSVLNQIPIFVIGKPGSSKSLAMGLVQSNLNGDASDNDFLRSLPAIEVFSYQCSPLSTSGGIQGVFETARRYHREATNTIVVVLLDEVGLAEQSPHLPLKVLHKMLDEASEGEAVVGISNWALDPAKMNRAVHLYRPAPSVEDLSLTAEGMVKSVNLKGYLHAIARAYNETYETQEHPDFWGLREFYSTVRSINSRLNAQKSSALDSDTLMGAVLRNFGGRPQEMEKIVNCFFEKIGLPIINRWESTSVESLIVQNLAEPDARHLMLLTRNNAALSLLLDREILKHDKTEIIFGSDFPLDQNDLHVCLNIQRIKLCMAEGIPVVIVHCESLYESLYDLLNQHYVEYGGVLYVRLAFGSYTRLCPLNRNFRVVVIVEKNDAYTRLAPPLLNRFEKQVFERGDVLTEDRMALVNRIQKFAETFVLGGQKKQKQELKGKVVESEESVELKTVTQSSLRAAFCGFHTDLISSLILSIESKKAGPVVAQDESEMGLSQFELQTKYENALFMKSIKKLLWIACPEATCRLMSNEEAQRAITREFGINCADEYFHFQTHSSLPAFANRMLKDWSDELGTQVVTLTYSPLSHEAVSVLKNSEGVSSVTHVVLHELDQERSLQSAVDDFFKGASDGSVLLVQCDPLATSKRRIEHTKFVVELARAKYYKSILDARAEKAKAKVEAKAAKERATIEAAAQNAEMEVAAAGGGGGGEVSGEGEGAVDAPMEELSEVPEGEMVVEEQKKEDESEVETCKNIHVILLLHLPRNGDEGEGKFCVDFDTRWNYAFIDSVASADTSGLPDVESMIGKSMLQVVQQLNIQKVLKRCFRLSLSRLVYSYDRTNEDIKRQITTILRCLDDQSFVDSVKQLLESMLADSTVSLDVSSIAQQEHELALSGTFQGAVHSKILSTVSELFGRILSHMDRNNSLNLLLDSRWSEVWKYLFGLSFNPALTGYLVLDRNPKSKNMKRRGDIPVKSDGFGTSTFTSVFPFSFFLYGIFESMRKTNEFLPEKSLIGAFATVGLQFDLSKALPSESIQDYVSDFVSMKCKESDHVDTRVVVLDEEEGSDAPPTRLTREVQTQLLMRILSSRSHSQSNASSPIDMHEEGQVPELSEVMDSEDGDDMMMIEGEGSRLYYLAQVHHRYWKVEQVVGLYFDILDTFPSAIPSVLRFFLDDMVQFDDNTHSIFIDLVFELLQPWAQSWTKVHDCEHWLSQVSSLRNHIHSLIDLISDPEIKFQNRMKWFKFDFYSSFVNQVAIPLELETNYLIDCLREFDLQQLHSSEALQSLIALLSKLNKDHVSEVTQDLICPITLERIVDPVTTADGMTFERSAILAWFASGKSTSPATNLPLASLKVTENVVMKEKLLAVANLDLSLFLEYFIFELIFSSQFQSSQLPLGLLMNLIELAAERCPVASLTAQDFKSVLPSTASRTAILRELFKVNDPVSKEFIFARTIEFLDESPLNFKFLDNRFSTSYLTVLEENSSLDLTSFESIESRLSSQQLSIKIPAVVCVRQLLSTLAGKLCASVSEGGGGVSPRSSESQRNEVDSLRRIIDPLLSTHALPPSIVRSMRMFLLKQIERRKGVSFLRDVLIHPQIKSSSWVQEWLNSGDFSFTKFLGSNRLPKSNPFLGFPCYSEVSKIITSFLITGDIPSIEIELSKLPQNANLQSALLLVLFNEVFLLNLLPLDSIRSLFEKRESLLAWLERPSALRFFESESIRRIVLFFSRGWDFLQFDESTSTDDVLRARMCVHLIAVTLSASQNHPFSFFRTLLLSPEKAVDNYFPTMVEDILSSMMDVMGGRWYRCPNGHPYYVDLCGRPTIILNCYHCGVPIGGESHNLLTNNIDIGNTGTNYYQTTKKDDNSEKGYCLKCSAEEEKERYFTARTLSPTTLRLIRFFLHMILHTGSTLFGLEWNTLLTSLFNSTLTGKVLPEELNQYFKDHEDSDLKLLKMNWTRSLDDISRSVHLILIGLTESSQLNDSSASSSSSTPTASFRELMERFSHLDQQALARMIQDIVRSRVGDESNIPAQFLVNLSRFLDDLESGEGNVSGTSVGNLIRSLRDPSNDSELPPPPPSIFQLSSPPSRVRRLFSTHDFRTLPSSELRSEWEKCICKDHISLFTDSKSDLATVFTEQETRFGISSQKDDEETGPFLLELLEKFDPNSLSQTERQEQEPFFWMYTSKFDVNHFVNSLSMSQGTTSNFPVLTLFAQQHREMASLRYIPHMLEWFHFLKGKFSGHITREAAQSMTCQEVLSGLSETEAPRIIECFQGYCHIWNTLWSLVKREGCLQFPEAYVSLVMSGSTAISFSLPSDADEGLCPMALVQYAINRHNAVVNLVDMALLLRVQRSQRENARAKGISSRFMTEAHGLRCDFESDIVPFLEKQCVLTSGYDFIKAETYLIDRFLTHAPAVDLEQSAFVFSHEGGNVLTNLSNKVSQQPLPLDTCESIQKDVSNPADAQRLLDVLENAIEFLNSTGGNISMKNESLGGMLFSKYLRTVLLSDDDLVSPVIATQVQLSHLNCLHSLLSQVIHHTLDPFENVHPRYKAQLSDHSRLSIEQAQLNIPFFDTELILSGLKSLILSSLLDVPGGAAMNEKESLFEILLNVTIPGNPNEDIYADLPWFDSFPRTILLSEIYHLYLFLKN